MDSETASINLIDMNTMKSKVRKKHVPKLPSLGKDHYGHLEGHSLLGFPRTYHKVFSSKQNRGYEQSLLLLSNRQSSPSPKTFSPVDSSGNASPDLSPKSVRKYEPPLDLSSNNLKSVLTSPGNSDVADIDNTVEEHRSQRNSFRGMQNFSFTSTKNHALNTKRTMCNKILQIIKDEGAFSTMHSFLIYLQMAPLDQQPLVASLLLQLDLLVEPRKMSIYREEAIDSLIEALKRKEFAICQTIALETLCSLSGRLSSLGKPLTEAWLLKTAGFDQPYKALMLEDQITMLEDEPLETLVWAIEDDEIHSVQVHDVKEAVHCFTSNGDLICFASQGAGIKVYNWKGASKPINFTRNVKCLAMTEDYIYCGCTGYNIQEVDLSNCSSMTFFSGPKKLLGKQSIHALCTEDGDLFVAGSSTDGMAGKVFSFLTKFVQIFKLTTCLCFMEVNMCSLEQSAGSLKSGQESASQELPQSN